MISRQNLMKLLGLASAVPAIPLSQASPETPSWIGQPVYHVLYWFEPAPINDFIEGGIYTVRADAEAHLDMRVAECKGRRSSAAAGVIVKMTHAQLCYSLADKRLGPMAEHMRRLMNIPAPNKSGEFSAGEIASLYGPHSEFPIAVAGKA